MPFVGLVEAGAPHIPLASTGTFITPLPLSPARRMPLLRKFGSRYDSDDEDGDRDRGGATGSDDGDDDDDDDAVPESRPRLVLREPIEGGRAGYSGVRRIDGCYFLMQVRSVV